VDDSRFDAVARLAGQSNRRTALRLLAASGLGVAVLHTVSEDADAKCVNPDAKCKKKNGKKRKCCGGAKCQGKRCRCQDNTSACGAFCCQSNEVCAGDVCKLKVGEACSAQNPAQCETGKCGCNGNLCACREANCKAKDVACNSSLSCCNGVCSQGKCSL
jgi:hypothetical protein